MLMLGWNLIENIQHVPDVGFTFQVLDGFEFLFNQTSMMGCCLISINVETKSGIRKLRLEFMVQISTPSAKKYKSV